MTLARRLSSAIALGIGSTAVVACGGSSAHGYVPLTAANLNTTMAAATADKHTAHEVSSSAGVTTTIDFDTAGLLRFRMTRAAAGVGSETLVGIGPDLYLQAAGTTPPGKWLKADPGVARSPMTAGQIDPVTMVSRFNKGIEKLTYVGPATIDGRGVQHYTITIDQAKYLAAVGQAPNSANLGAGTPIVEQLYLNPDNTLRRVILVLPGGVGNAQVDVTGWGQPVSIEAPSPSAVVTSTPKSSKR